MPDKTCGSKLYDTLFVFLKGFSEKFNFGKNKAVFSEENYAPHRPKPQIESAIMLIKIIISYHCVTIIQKKEWLKFINYFKESMHKHNFGQNLKLQSAVVTLNIRSR